MFGIGTWEIVCILLFALMFYGPEQLPGIAKKVAYVVKHFKKISHEVTSVVQKELAQIERETQLKEMKQQVEAITRNSKNLVDDVKREVTSVKDAVEQEVPEVFLEDKKAKDD